MSADKDIDSPYNTYRYKGLPPGPICLVNPSTIDAVLNYSKHNYTYFCAKADFSGYSNFTNDYKVHMKNAAAYQEALENGFEEPKELQKKCIPKINGGADVIAIGPNGSGKSTTIMMSAIQKLGMAFEDAPRALIIVSDEVKALEMKDQFRMLSKNTDLRAEVYKVK